MGKSGVGMPSALMLDQFAVICNDAFCGGSFGVYQVGSSLESTAWRDVDVRVILEDAQYEALGLGDPAQSHTNAKWVALTLAFSALGKQMTGLPIDFQIQQQSHANEENTGPRSALGLRFANARHATATECADSSNSL